METSFGQLIAFLVDHKLQIKIDPISGDVTAYGKLYRGAIPECAHEDFDVGTNARIQVSSINKGFSLINCGAIIDWLKGHVKK